MLKRLSLFAIVVLALALPAAAQPSGDLQSAVSLFQKVRTVANVTYIRANGWEGKLDVYAQRTPPNSPASPVVIFIHGGGWVQGTKEGSILQGVLPYVAMGYSVVNVEYRLGNVSLAPAAVEDCRCALRWVVAHATDYKFDTDRIVIAGESAGGHLALTTGMLKRADGFDRMCQEESDPKVAAIVNFFGITDLPDMLDGPNKKPFPERWPYTVQWIGNQPNRVEIAKA